MEVNVNSSLQMASLLIATELKDGRTVPKRTGAVKIKSLKTGLKVDVGSKYVLIDGTLADCSDKTGAVSLGADILEEMTHPLAKYPSDTTAKDRREINAREWIYYHVT
jgi:hypothetical protein